MNLQTNTQVKEKEIFEVYKVIIIQNVTVKMLNLVY